MRGVSAITLRLAEEKDIPALHALIEASVRGLQADDYTSAQIEGALGTVLGLDTQLIADRTYFVAEADDGNTEARKRIVACGGWSKRKTLFGADRGPGRAPELLGPVHTPGVDGVASENRARQIRARRLWRVHRRGRE